MVNLPYRMRTRSLGAQIDRMKAWPNFEVTMLHRGGVMWVGRLRGFQRFYIIRITWIPGKTDRPYVQLIDPPLEPLEGGTYENIPHLMFSDSDPLSSGLCLFDPEVKEWADNMLIADTTVPWTARWLYYYELWHYDGIWRGGGVGAESVGAVRAAALYEQKEQHVSHKT